MPHMSGWTLPKTAQTVPDTAIPHYYAPSSFGQSFCWPSVYRASVPSGTAPAVVCRRQVSPAACASFAGGSSRGSTWGVSERGQRGSSSRGSPRSPPPWSSDARLRRLRMPTLIGSVRWRMRQTGACCSRLMHAAAARWRCLRGRRSDRLSSAIQCPSLRTTVKTISYMHVTSYTDLVNWPCKLTL